MKTFLTIWIIINGVDVGGQPIEMPSFAECLKRSEQLLSASVPDEVQKFAVACIREKSKDNPA